jgi:glycosyltransferase involved in cell wall biosynthesis
VKIAVDLQSCQTDSRFRGIGRYSLSLAAAMREMADDQTELVYALDGGCKDRLADARHRIRSRMADPAVMVYDYPRSPAINHSPALGKAAATLRSEAVIAAGAHVMLCTSFFEAGDIYTTELDFDRLAEAGVSTAVVAYDLIPLIFPEHYLPERHPGSHWYREKLEAFKRFDHFLAISEATKRDLMSLLDIPEERITVIGAGLDPHLHGDVELLDAEGDDLLDGLGISRPFVFMVGNADWRKNSIGALDAFAALPESVRSAHQLVFVRVSPDVESALAGKYAHLRQQVVILGQVSDAELSFLYTRCKLFFFPSLYEGFGLPIIEAMAHGAPVISSSRGSLAEVVPNPDMLFDPRDAALTREALLRALTDDTFRERLCEEVVQHARGFIWANCASHALASLEAIVQRAEVAMHGAFPSHGQIVAFADAIAEVGEDERALREGLEVIASGGRRRILVDMTEVIRNDARSGIQRVVRNYVAGLGVIARETGGFEVVPFHWTDRGVMRAQSFLADGEESSLVAEDQVIVVRQNDLVFMLDSTWERMERFDAFVAEIKAARAELVWMVYDLVPILVAGTCHPGMPPVFRAWLEYAVRHSDGFVCISEATRVDLEEFITASPYSGENRPWSRSLHLGSDLESGVVGEPTEVSAGVVAALQGRPYCIAVGTLEPRKDYDTILLAFELLWSEGRDECLVMVGKAGWNVESLVARIRSHAELGRRLFWLDHASDADLSHLLLGSAALVQASVLEGFGLPVVEAGSQGIPLVLSDIAVFREIAGDEARFFEQGSPESLSEQLRAGFSGEGWIFPGRIRTMSWRESSRALAKLLLGVAKT